MWISKSQLQSRWDEAHPLHTECLPEYLCSSAFEHKMVSCILHGSNASLTPSSCPFNPLSKLLLNTRTRINGNAETKTPRSLCHRPSKSKESSKSQSTRSATKTTDGSVRRSSKRSRNTIPPLSRYSHLSKLKQDAFLTSGFRTEIATHGRPSKLLPRQIRTRQEHPAERLPLHPFRVRRSCPRG